MEEGYSAVADLDEDQLEHMLEMEKAFMVKENIESKREFEEDDNTLMLQTPQTVIPRNQVNRDAFAIDNSNTMHVDSLGYDMGALSSELTVPPFSSGPECNDEMPRIEENRMKMNRAGSKYQAELSLLNALGKPRKSHAKDNGLQKMKPQVDKPWLSLEEKLEEERLRPDYLHMSKGELEAFRPAQPLEVVEKRNKLNLEKSRVQTLPRIVHAGESSTGLSKVRDTTKSRQVRHDEALRAFKEVVVVISEELEIDVIQKGRDLRTKIGDVDETIAKIVAQLEDSQNLRSKDYTYMTDVREQLDTLCEERKTAITDFDQALEQVEEVRSKRVGDKLKDLVDELLSISYKLRGEVERLLEKETYEINGVLINNIRVKSQLIAMMLKRQVVVSHRTKATWTKAELQWRNLQHEKTLEEWSHLLHSERFTNPEERNQIISDSHIQQAARHKGKRLVLLGELKSLVSAENAENTCLPYLTVQRIEVIKKQLEQVHAEEVESNEKIYQALLEQQKRMQLDMNASRETLRAELHTYAALAEEGDIFTQGKRGEGSAHRIRLGKMIADSELDVFFSPKWRPQERTCKRCDKPW
mmetsp:Transcript_16371/g.35700  ORF Transcript_16371/g.35700 Transcript_16371/m.35700 type:complete len:585 (+) Transcript_16371:409-2163(+)